MNSKLKNRKIKNHYKYSIFTYMSFILLVFSIFGLKGVNSKSNNAESEDIYSLDEQKKMFDLKKIKENPKLVTDYYLKILDNSSKLNLELFDKNVKIIKEKIYEIIKYKNEYKNLYIILSSIYGAFLADAMGSNTEFKPKSKNNHLDIYGEGSGFQPGQVTDDSEMAMSQAYGILDNYQYKDLNPNLLYYYYVLWVQSHPYDIGFTTRNALGYLDFNNTNITDRNIFTEKIKSKIKAKNSESLANGFLMRDSPLLTWFYMVHKDYVKESLQTKSSEKYFELYKKIHEQVEKDTQLTHPNPETAVSGSIMIFMGLCTMQQNYTGKEILDMTMILLKHSYFNDQTNEIEYKIKNHFIAVLEEISKPNFSKDEFFGDLFYQMGFYKHAFNLTIYYLSVIDELKKTMNLKDIYNYIMFEISDFGGDTDTNGAIVGMVIGPLIGMENYDRKYFDVLLNFYSRDRILYTSVYMYFYAKYLEEIENSKLIVERDVYKINFYAIEVIIRMLNTEINW